MAERLVFGIRRGLTRRVAVPAALIGAVFVAVAIWMAGFAEPDHVWIIGVLAIIGAINLLMAGFSWATTCDSRPLITLSDNGFTLRATRFLHGAEMLALPWSALQELRLIPLGLGRDQLHVIVQANGRQRNVGFALRLMDAGFDDVRLAIDAQLKGQGKRLGVPHGYVRIWRVILSGSTY